MQGTELRQPLLENRISIGYAAGVHDPAGCALCEEFRLGFVYLWHAGKPLYFPAGFMFARVDEYGQFVGYLTTRVDGLTLGSLYDWLQSMDFGFLLSTEPLMVVDHIYVNAWNGIGWLVD